MLREAMSDIERVEIVVCYIRNRKSPWQIDDGTPNFHGMGLFLLGDVELPRVTVGHTCHSLES
jgi:hypothetical protein